MRLDKYLKVAQVLKRRTVSNAIAKQNKVSINGRPAKAGHQVKVGDLITIQFGNRILSIKVLRIQVPKSKDGEPMYEIVETVYKENEG